MISPGDEVYEGRSSASTPATRDLAVNPLKGKKLTNMRASGKDDAIALTLADCGSRSSRRWSSSRTTSCSR